MRAMWRAVALALACLIAAAPAAHAQLITGTALTASGAVTSITGTASQVIASAATGPVTLSLPQSIATTSIPQFAGLGIGAAGASGKIHAADGTSALPSYTFGSDTNTGFYLATTDQVGFVAGGALQFTVNASGLSVYSSAIAMSSTAFLGWGDGGIGTVDTKLYRGAANTLELRNDTNAQAFRVTNTWTSASVLEYLSIAFATNVARIGTKHIGATARVLTLDYGGTSTAAISIPITSGGIAISGLTVTGAATGKTVVCVDTATGILYASTSGVECAN